MNAEVFWISATELEFGGRIYTWDGWCWTDKNGISRTLYLRDKGVILGCGKGGGKLVKGDVIMAGPGKKQKGDSKGRNNKGDNKGDKRVTPIKGCIQFDGDNKEGDIEERAPQDSDNTDATLVTPRRLTHVSRQWESARSLTTTSSSPT